MVPQLDAPTLGLLTGPISSNGALQKVGRLQVRAQKGERTTLFVFSFPRTGPRVWVHDDVRLGGPGWPRTPTRGAGAHHAGQA